MKKHWVEKVISLLDPIGVYGIAPLDEYSDTAKRALDILDKGDAGMLKQFLLDQYSTQAEASLAKVNLAVDLIVFIKENCN